MLRRKMSAGQARSQAILAAALIFVSVPTAAAAVVGRVGPDAQLEAGPVLWGTGVAWIERRRSTRELVRARQDRGQRPIPLRGRGEVTDLASSGRRVAFVRQVVFQPRGPSCAPPFTHCPAAPAPPPVLIRLDLWVAAGTGMPLLVHRRTRRQVCRGRGGAKEVELSEGRIVVLEGTPDVHYCSAGDDNPPERVVVLQAGRPSTDRAITLAAGRPGQTLRHLRVAGRWAAWKAEGPSASEIVVADLKRARIAYRIRPSATGDPAFDIDATGRIVTSEPLRTPLPCGRLRYRHHRLRVRSAQGESLAQLPPVPVVDFLALEGGRLIYPAWTRSCGPKPGFTVRALDSGRATWVTGPCPPLGLSLGRDGFDGRHLALTSAEPPCTSYKGALVHRLRVR